MTGYYLIEEADEFHADDFANDSISPLIARVFADAAIEQLLDTEADEFHAEDFANDTLWVPLAPIGLQIRVDSG